MRSIKRMLVPVASLLMALSVSILAAESDPKPVAANVPNFTNLDFEIGVPGGLPPGWIVPKAPAALGFIAVITTDKPSHGNQCVEIRWPKDFALPSNLFANFVQHVDPTLWRGKRIKVTAAIRVASAENGRRAQMWFRVDGPGGVSAFDNMDDRPVISTNWADYSITADVAEDAQTINLGVITLNGATAWLDNVRVEVLSEFDSRELEVLEGNWKGALEIGPISLRVFFIFEKTPNNRMRGYFVSPDQSETRLPLARMTLNDKAVNFPVPSIGGTYTGQLDRVSREMKGTWVQGKAALPLTLAFTETDWKLRRPQTPKPPFPYATEDVAFENAKAQVKLAGTISKPNGSGPFPAFILISGSGPQDRDETLFGHKPFAVIADFLSRNGYAVLRYDDRGFGKSTGNFAAATSEDFSYDAEAAMDYLRTRRDVDSRRIGFVGHSEGGMIAPMIAARRTDVAFLVLLAAPGVSGEEIALAQSEASARAIGFSEEGIQKCRPLNREAIRVMASKLSADDKKSKLDELEQKMIPLMGEKDRQHCAKFKDEHTANRETGMTLLQTGWMQYMLRYDPASNLQRVKCPVLALNGQLDKQVLPMQNLPELERAVKAGGNSRITTKELKGLNHLFQTAQTGDLKEYGEIEESFAPSALTEILAWLNANMLTAE